MSLFLSLTYQLLTFDLASSGVYSNSSCLHLYYKLTERRGPQVSILTL